MITINLQIHKKANKNLLKIKTTILIQNKITHKEEEILFFKIKIFLNNSKEKNIKLSKIIIKMLVLIKNSKIPKKEKNLEKIKITFLQKKFNNKLNRLLKLMCKMIKKSKF